MRAAAFKDYAELMDLDSPQAQAESLVRNLRFVLEPELGAGFADFLATAEGDALIAHPMSTAEIFIGEEVPYVADYESTSVPDLAQEIADPVIKTLQEGQLLRVRAAPVADRLRMRVRYESSHLVRPIPVETRRIGSGGFEVQVQRPEISAQDRQTTAFRTAAPH